MLADTVKAVLIMSVSLSCMRIDFQHSPRRGTTLEGVRASFRWQSGNIGLCLPTRKSVQLDNQRSQWQKKYLHYNSAEAYLPLRERPKRFQTSQIAVISSLTNRLSFWRCSMWFHTLLGISMPPLMSTFWKKNTAVMFCSAATCRN